MTITLIIGSLTVLLSAIRTVLSFVRTEATLEAEHTTEDVDAKLARQRRNRNRIPVWLRKGNTDE